MFDQVTDKVEDERKFKEVSSKYQSLSEKYNQLKN